MTVRTHRIALAAAAIALAAGVALALRPGAVPVEVAEADTGPVQATVDWTGKTRVRDRFQVAAPVSGQLERPTLRAGDRVQVGQTVARILGAAASPLDPRSRAEASARLDAALAAEVEAEAARARAVAAADQARRDAERAEEVGRAGALSAQALEGARAEARVRDDERRMAEAAARRAAAEVASARATLQAGGVAAAAVEVRAPVDGAVLRVMRDSAGPVAAGTPLLALGDPTRLEVVLDLPTADAVRVRPGQRATVSGWGGGARLEASVRRVEPSAYTKISPLGVEEQRVDVVLDPAGVGWAALGDGFTVDVQVVVEQAEGAVRVPASALRRDGDGWVVFVVEGGRARRRPVEVALRGDGLVALREGVRAGERVVIHPDAEVGEGVRVVAR